MFGYFNLIGGLVFGTIGFVAFVYGKKQAEWKPITIGITLMVYPYFVSDVRILYAVGTLLCLALLFSR